MRFRPYGQTRAVCPYYLRDSELSISCVPPCEEAEKCAICFTREEEKRRYMRLHCFQREGEMCAMREMLERENRK